VALTAVIGRRVRLIIPVGLEKRISGNFDEIANKVNVPGNTGYRFFPMQGEVIPKLKPCSFYLG